MLSMQGEETMEKDDCDLCLLPKAEGSCRGMHPRWFNNGDECEFFFFGGCSEGANDNNFETLEGCEEKCAGCRSSSTQNDTAIKNIVTTITVDDIPSNGDYITFSKPLIALSTSPLLGGSDIVIEQDDEGSNGRVKDKSVNNNDIDGKSRADPIVFEEPSVQVLLVDEEKHTGAPSEPKEKEVYFTSNPICVIIPPSASLVDPENHKVYLPSGKIGDKRLVSMTCKDVQLGGAAGLISKESCSKVKSSLACPFEWSNLIGENGENAKETIEKDTNNMMPIQWKKKAKISVIEQQWWFSNFDWSALSTYKSSSSSTRSERTSIEKLSSSDGYYQTDRIRIYVDNNWNVITAPRIG